MVAEFDSARVPAMSGACTGGWQVQPAVPITTFEHTDLGDEVAALLVDGTDLLVGTASGDVWQLELSSFAAVGGPWEGHLGPVTSMAVMRDASTGTWGTQDVLITGSEDRQVVARLMGTNTILFAAAEQSGMVTGVAEIDGVVVAVTRQSEFTQGAPVYVKEELQASTPSWHEAGAPGSCPVMVACQPADACLANNLCNAARGYTGYRCQECIKGYYKVQGECLKCPDNPWLLFLIAGLVLAFAAAAGWFLNSNKVHLALVSIGVDYFQVLAIFTQSKIAWPTPVKRLLNILSAFNLNIDLTAPECTIETITYGDRWAITMALPILILSVFVVSTLVRYLYKRFIRKVPSERRWSHAPALIGIYFTLFYFMYLLLARATFDVFQCAPVIPDDGYGPGYMQVTGDPCMKSGGLHLQLLPWAIIAAFAYLLLYPALVGTILMRNKETLKLDQLLFCLGTGDTRASNPTGYEFRKKFRKLYYYFKPGKWYWILLIVGRKFWIAITALLFQATPAFQLAVALLVLVGAYAMQVQHRPYLSVRERRDILLLHDQKVLEGNEKHLRIQAEMSDIASKRKYTTGKADMDSVRKQHMNPAAEAATDYNTVEQFFLLCAVLVSLSGIMFESNRLEEGSPWLRDTLAWLVLLLIVFSIIYYVFVFTVEILTVIAPNMASRLPCFRAKGKSTVQLEAEAAAAAGAGVIPASALTVNPLLESRSGPLSDEDLAEAERILLAPRPPSLPQWQLVKAYLKFLGKDTADLQKILADLRRKELLAKTGAKAKKTSAARTRRQFGQQVAGSNSRASMAAALGKKKGKKRLSIFGKK
jgi:hypothetical protein